MNMYLSMQRVLPLASIVLLVSLLGQFGQRPGLVHAAPAATIMINSCDETSLRMAVANAAPGDTIRFACSGIITLSGTPLTINKNVTLDGNGQNITLSGGGTVRIFQVISSVIFTLNALTIANGLASSFGGGGLLAQPGSIININYSTFANNLSGTGGQGGALLAQTGSTVNVNYSNFINNSATANGGALASITGTVDINYSTIAYNSASNQGGGLFSFLGGTTTVNNSTFAYNSASSPGGEGGGLALNGSTMSISNSTIAYNSAPTASGIANTGSNPSAATGSSTGSIPVTITQSIVANNAGGNCLPGVPFIDGGYNLENGMSCGFNAATDQQNPNPQLGPLANNGGSTPTIALLPGSPAMDKIPAPRCPATDQRGFTRPYEMETVCDIGAFESGAVPPPVVIIR